MSINKVVDYQVDETHDTYVHVCAECGHTRSFNLPDTQICEYCDEQFRTAMQAEKEKGVTHIFEREDFLNMLEQEGLL